MTRNKKLKIVKTKTRMKRKKIMKLNQKKKKKALQVIDELIKNFKTKNKDEIEDLKIGSGTFGCIFKVKAKDVNYSVKQMHF